MEIHRLPGRGLLVVSILASALLVSGALAQSTNTITLTTSDALKKSGAPGSSVSFAFTVKNENSLAEATVSFAGALVPTDYGVSFQPAGENVKIPAGATQSGKFVVKVPSNATVGDHHLAFYAYQGTATAPIFSTPWMHVNVTVPPPAPPATVAPPPPPKLAIDADPSLFEAPAGAVLKARVVVSMQDAPSGADVTITRSFPTGWPTDSVTGLPSGATLSSGDRKEYPVEIRVPGRLAVGSSHEIAITVAATGADAKTATIAVRVIEAAPASPEPTDPAPAPTSRNAPTGGGGDATVAPESGTPPTPEEEPVATIGISLDPPSLRVEAGGLAEGSILLTNPSDAPREVAISSSLDGTGWAFTVAGGATVNLQPGSPVRVPFTIRAPASAPVGKVAALVRAHDAAADLAIDVTAPAPPAAGRDVAESASGPAAQAPLDRVLEERGAGVLAAAAGVAAAGAGGMYLASSPAARRHLWWIFLGLYTRLTRPKLLDHPERVRLFRVIETTPGIHFHALQRELGWNTGALTYHLRVLERHQIVTSRRDGILRRFYLVGTAPRALPVAVAPTGEHVSLSGLRGNVLSTVRDRGRIAQSALAEELGASKQTLNYHVKNLERLGLLRVERVGRDTVLSLVEPASLAGARPTHPAAANAVPPPGLALAEGGFSRPDE